MNIRVISILWYLLWFLIANTSSFHTSFSLVWLGFSLDILYCLWLLWKVFLPSFLSQFVWHLYLTNTFYYWGLLICFELIFYPATFLKMFIRCRSSMIDFFVSVMQTIILSANNNILMSYFSNSFSLDPFKYLIALAINSSICYIDKERIDRLVLFLILAEVLWVSFHLIWCWLQSCCCLYYV